MNIRERLTAILPPLQSACADAFALLARISIGQAFIQAGWGKLANLEGTTAFFTSLGIPAPGFHAALVGGVELLGGIALVLGLGLRLSALVLLGTMAVAILTAERANFLAALAINPDKGLTDVVPWMFGLILLALFAHGGGRLAIDRCFAAGRKPTA